MPAQQVEAFSDLQQQGQADSETILTAYSYQPAWVEDNSQASRHQALFQSRCTAMRSSDCTIILLTCFYRIPDP